VENAVSRVSTHREGGIYGHGQIPSPDERVPSVDKCVRFDQAAGRSRTVLTLFGPDSYQSLQRNYRVDLSTNTSSCGRHVFVFVDLWMIRTTPHRAIPVREKTAGTRRAVECHPRKCTLWRAGTLRRHLRGECIPRAPGLFECASLIRSFTQTRPFGNMCVCDVAPGDAGCWTGSVSFFSESGFVTLRGCGRVH